MDQEPFNLMTLLLPHRLTMEIHKLRDSFWKTSGNISTKVLPPCIPLLPMHDGESISEDINWRTTTLVVSPLPISTSQAILLPFLSDEPIQRLRTELQERLARPYDADNGVLVGIPSLVQRTGVYVSSYDEGILRHMAARELVLAPFDDARLALIRCTPMKPGTLEQGAGWEILEQRHLVGHD